MMKLISVDRMKELEAMANEQGLSYRKMMENAGTSQANEVISRFLVGNINVTVIGFVGSGNNGGDTLIALEQISEAGYCVFAFYHGSDLSSNEFVNSLKSKGGEVFPMDKGELRDFLKIKHNSNFIILDGILGTGFHPPISNEIKDFLIYFSKIRSNLDCNIIAVDCPSGVDCTTGKVDVASLRADLTISMSAVKEGLLKFPAFDYVGDLVTVDIGLSKVISDWELHLTDILQVMDAKRILPKRSDNSHKGTFGKVLVVGGSINYCGAAILSGLAAYRVGSGLVTIATPEPVFSAMASLIPEATWLILPSELGCISKGAIKILDQEDRNDDVVLLGPGLGFNDTTRKFLNAYINGGVYSGNRKIGFDTHHKNQLEQNQGKKTPLVIDADALKCLSQINEWWKDLPEIAVITPHPGEMSALTGESIEAIQSNRIDVAQKYAAQWGITVVLKGALTIIADPKHGTTILPIATSALAHAGTGDVLAGIIASYIGQGLNGYDASLLACYIHASAALKAKEKLGCEEAVLSRDIIDQIGKAITEIK